MRRRSLESSVLASAAYDPERRILELEFTSGDLYRYWIVPARVWNELLDADSKGQYFASHIRDRFPTERVDPP
ncbi:KTSC domain-containing protein [Leifsonia sp. NPDC058292]|uniref:KTSC domain-containing protein n=1 Tax=Leifsonia sp. NPDC058292 TaxID=3346428 RepID=UPI0036DDF3ED